MTMIEIEIKIVLNIINDVGTSWCVLRSGKYTYLVNVVNN